MAPQEKDHAYRIFRAALEAADPEQAVLRHLRIDGDALIAGRRRYRLSRFDRIHVVGAGKASASMARAVERTLGRRVSSGVINVPDGRRQPRLKRIELQPSGHPVPDDRGLKGARRILEIARRAGEKDLLICLISGGASALMPTPAPPVTLAAEQRVTRQLLKCGATIHEINTIRKHISFAKGGQLAALAWPATVITLILSDVIGDDPGVIGSGPTAPDSSTAADAARVFEKYSIRQIPLRETPKPGDPEFTRVQNLIVGSNRQAVDAAARKARALGYRTMVLSTSVEGEAREVALVHAAIIKEILDRGQPLRAPACVLSGGETTVTVRGKGVGGRNQEFVLAAALALDGLGPFIVFSAGTDGADGPTDAAGAIADEQTLHRARALMREDLRRFLADNNSYRFFEKIKGLVKTGPTGTNVMDIRILLVPAK
ncbi:MAG TPA: glycerate kinase [Bryobacteraceae bacterium]|jgi:hydroxypyruvate reductase